MCLKHEKRPAPTDDAVPVSGSALAFSDCHPHLVAVVCGFAKDTDLYPNYIQGKFGEDAWFKTSTASADVLGVADGVGGWRAHGIDPGQFSSYLMHSCERLVHGQSFDPSKPAELLASSFCDLMEQKQPILGSSTACVVTFERLRSTLHAANIGDSGFLVLRNGAIVCRSREQQHFFNTPYQLSMPPPGHNLQVLSDGPECAEILCLAVKPGDVILLATDGIFDNVSDDLLLQVVSELEGVNDPVQLQMAANCLALMARMLSFNSDYISPFTLNARRNNIEAIGGKPDDITVILATVVE
ncbi:protein phosphatase PTC7 homolog [Scaptodrosophila lebanonensis]|uniref:Protein phosphatase n=1 Tax=Drosophila lebanonensis TaxID=7225 RepID=A0A6J2TYT6_DROLE|nr:protein phosphatase PTC7 homolog [Scaptodrosophila lebanonensis]